MNSAQTRRVIAAGTVGNVLLRSTATSPPQLAGSSFLMRMRSLSFLRPSAQRSIRRDPSQRFGAGRHQACKIRREIEREDVTSCRRDAGVVRFCRCSAQRPRRRAWRRVMMPACSGVAATCRLLPDQDIAAPASTCDGAKIPPVGRLDHRCTVRRSETSRTFRRGDDTADGNGMPTGPGCWHQTR
jgi:hypothetical protein